MGNRGGDEVKQGAMTPGKAPGHPASRVREAGDVAVDSKSASDGGSTPPESTFKSPRLHFRSYQAR